MKAGGAKVVVISRCAWTLFNFRVGLVHAIEAAGCQVVTMGSGDDGYGKNLSASGISFRSIRLSRRGISPLSDLRLLLELVFKLASERPAVVHNFTIKPAVFGTIAAWLCRVPIRVVTVTGLGYAFTSAKPWLSSFALALYRFALARAHFVFFQNDSDREFFLNRGVVKLDNSAVVAGSGVDLEYFKPVPFPNVTDRGLTFLMVARLIKEKGVLEFVEAASRIRATFPAAQFVLVGSEDPRNPTALSEADLDTISRSPVRRLGPVDDVRPIIQAAHVVVLPSYREGMPRAILEAAAMGRPAITTDTIGCRDAVVDGTTGHLVKVKDVDSLVEAMERFLRAPASVETMGLAARARVAELFDEKAVIATTIQKYQDLIAEKVCRPGKSPRS